MEGKTKAVALDRQCGFWYRRTKLKFNNTRALAGGQSLGAPEITGTAPMAWLGGMPIVGPTPFGSTNFSVYQQCTAMAYTPQPFGSMPRCCSSLRMMRLIHAASDSSPSCCCACSISSRSSGSSRNWNGGLPRLSFLCVDTSITPDVMCLCVMTHYIHEIQIATPRSAGTLPRRLTNNVNRSNAMAKPQCNQTHPKFTWLFLATPKSHPDCSPIVLRFDTDTEENARAAFPGWEMVFAAKIRAEAPCRVAFFDYNTRRGWAFDSASDREVVGHD